MDSRKRYDELLQQSKSALKNTPWRITVGMATCGLTAGAGAVYDCLCHLTADMDEVRVDRVGCIGACFLEPIVEVFEPSGRRVTYVKMTPEKAQHMFFEHLRGGKINAAFDNSEDDINCLGGPIATGISLAGPYGLKDKQTTNVEDASFYKAQKRIVLRRCGLIDPENINHCIADGGYAQLARVLDTMTPDEVIEAVSASGLRGRGGAGFPTGRKWRFTADAVSPDGVKYVCCNADEGDPGAFMDRSVLESDPHAVIEAMAIAAYTVGATQGYIYIRAEYPIAVKRLQIAIDQARACGILGQDMLGSGHAFELELRLGAGAFVCGEETALLTSIEGNRGEPRPRPPFPAVEGLFGKPTLLNNVETYASITWIIEHGARAYSAIGTETSKGTKVFALGGKIKQAGLVEVAMGTSLRTIINRIGGGVPQGKAFKAAQTGGPSGGCIPAAHIDTPIDYESLAAIGSMMGSGGLIVMDEDNCMVDIAKFFLDFVVDESCGKCVPCRIGTKRLLMLLDKICKGEATMDDLDLIKDLCSHLQSSSLCALGQSAPNPVLSTLRHFEDEYLDHIQKRHCEAGVCKSLLHYVIDPLKCRGCTKCARNCPVEAITGERKKPHSINPNLCIGCGTCMQLCHFDAISKN